MIAFLPDWLFLSLPNWLLLVIVVVCIAALVRGADWLVESAASLAYRLGMSKVIVGATIVSLGTTSPEAAVSVLAAWKGNAGLALGNGVGSIICNAGLIFGLGLVLTRLPADRFVLTRQGWVKFGSAALLAVLSYWLFYSHGDDAAIPRWAGGLMTVLLAAYLLVSARWSRQHPSGEPHIINEDQIVGPLGEDEPEVSDQSVPMLLAWGLLGLAVVVISSDALVQSASIVAESWGVPKAVIASTLVAFGTSLPELVVGMTAIRRGHSELLVGNIIGANILNVLFVIGVSSLAAPLPIVEVGTVWPRIFLDLHLPTMMVMLGVMFIYIRIAARSGSFSRWMGVPLLAIYGVFVGITIWAILPPTQG